jgi:hypothetical protein
MRQKSQTRVISRLRIILIKNEDCMMRHRVEAVPEEPVARAKCRHYWIIESPNGPTSRGVCKLCGAEKEFQNFFPDSWWAGDISPLLEPRGLAGIEPDGKRGDS